MSLPPIDLIQQTVPLIVSETRSLLLSAINRVVDEVLTDQKQNRTGSMAISSLENLHILSLPDEILLSCFSWLTFSSLGKCLRVCRRFNELGQDSTLWNPLLHKDWRIVLNKQNPVNPKTLYQNLSTGKYNTRIVELPKGVSCVQTTAKQNLFLIGYSNGIISLFDLETRSSLPIVGLQTRINCLHITDAKLVCGTEDGSIGIFNINQEHEKSDMVFRLPGSNAIHSIHIFGSKLFVGHSNFITIWDIEKEIALGLLQQQPEVHEYDFYNRVVHGNDTHLFVGLENGKLESWDFEKKTCLTRFQAHEGEISCMQLVGSHLFTSSGSDSKIKIWDINHWHCLRVLKVDEGGFCFRVVGSKLFYDWYNKIKILDIETGKSTTLCAQPLDEDSILRKMWIVGTKIFSRTDESIYIYDFA